MNSILRIINCLTYVVMIIIFISCDSNIIKPDLTPQEQIIGKWELTERGNLPGLEKVERLGYYEYREDGLVLFFDYEDNRFTTETEYYMTDTTLVNVFYPEADRKIEFKYNFKFYRDGMLGKEKLQLDLLEFTPIYKTFIYNKIN